ncbi:hypothetical protein SAMN05216464_1043 [Mucilaginibacter pineti]|uniref:Uncharacterized protein n=1 Tax=Mucilaginibacter pineti TaxID=1391627 RepID=A0A1G7A8K3_9SPHI|nr:hypothetical protein [Mucilaginibacter pineti]SDE11214.1 hypothetical protein SAMN05216464_1043 [Mucilaginibacter pineti]
MPHELPGPVPDYFTPYFKNENGCLVFDYLHNGRAVAREYWSNGRNAIPSGPGLWISGSAVPGMVRHLFLFHSAAEAISFCGLRPALLEQAASNAFAALGLLPEAQQLSWLAATYPHSKLHLVFGGDLLGAITDCKTAMWHKSKDVRFSLAGGQVRWRWHGGSFEIPEHSFSFHRFQQECGLRLGFRTHKPPSGLESFKQFIYPYDT